MLDGKLLKNYEQIETMQRKLRDAHMESQSSPIAILQLPREEIGHLLHLVRKSIVKNYQPPPQYICKKVQPTVSKKRKRPKPATNNRRNPPPRNYVCRRCKIPGHWLEDCTMKQPNRPPEGYICHRCNKPGHWIAQCPSRAMPRAPPAGYVCHACGAKDHYIKDCPNKKGKSQNNNNNFRAPSPPQQRWISRSPTPPHTVVKPEFAVKEEDFVGPVSNMPGPISNESSRSRDNFAGPSNHELDLLEQLLGNDNVSSLFDRSDLYSFT